MNNYKDEYGIQDMDAEAQETLELMHEKLDTHCSDKEMLQDENGADATSEVAGKRPDREKGKC